jgi:hypothetical protein
MPARLVQDAATVMALPLTVAALAAGHSPVTIVSLSDQFHVTVTGETYQP